MVNAINLAEVEALETSNYGHFDKLNDRKLMVLVTVVTFVQA